MSKQYTVSDLTLTAGDLTLDHQHIVTWSQQWGHWYSLNCSIRAESWEQAMVIRTWRNVQAAGMVEGAFVVADMRFEYHLEVQKDHRGPAYPHVEREEVEIMLVLDKDMR